MRQIKRLNVFLVMAAIILVTLYGSSRSSNKFFGCDIEESGEFEEIANSNENRDSFSAFVGQVVSLTRTIDGSVEKSSDMITVRNNIFEVSAAVLKSYVGDCQDNPLIRFNVPYEFDSLPFAEGQNMLFILEHAGNAVSDTAYSNHFYHAFRTVDGNWVTDYYSGTGLFQDFFKSNQTDVELTEGSYLPSDQYRYKGVSHKETEGYYVSKGNRMIPKLGVPSDKVVSFVFDRFLMPPSHTVADMSGRQAAVPVDLGLSVCWASCNLGAVTPEASGSYYAWGAIAEQERYDGLIPEKFQDVANVLLGDSWRIPTYAECEELVSNCDWEWTETDDTSGFTVKSRVNGNSIFIPAAGYWTDRKIQNCGYYWTSSTGFIQENAKCFIFFKNSRRPKDNWHEAEVLRSYGLTIRPVKTKHLVISKKLKP